MRKRQKASLTYSNKEILDRIQNAVIAASRSANLELDEHSVRRLRTYTEAVLAPLRQHVEEPDLHFTSEQLVVVLLTAAQFVQTFDAMNLDNSPYDQSGVLGNP